MSEYERIKQIKQKYEHELLSYPNVVGIGIGFRFRFGQRTNEMSLIVMVTRKRRHKDLSLTELIPQELDGVPVDVQEIGEIEAL